MLVDHLEQWSEAKGIFAGDRLNEYHRRQRQQLLCYVWFLATSGLRVGEANKLRWANIQLIDGSNGALPVRDAAAEAFGLESCSLEQALLIEYGPGASIGWHKDRPVFGDVIGAPSLAERLSTCSA